jgi:hypothetical protein
MYFHLALILLRGFGWQGNVLGVPNMKDGNNPWYENWVIQSSFISFFIAIDLCRFGFFFPRSDLGGITATT